MERERVNEPDADQLSDYDKTIRHYQEWAERQKNGKLLVRRDELPWELNAHGRMQWYLHPSLVYTAVQTQMFYRREIPAGSRSGARARATAQ